MPNKIDVTFLNEGTIISTKTFDVPDNGLVPIPADVLFAYLNAELRIKANHEEKSIEQVSTNEAH